MDRKNRDREIQNLHDKLLSLKKINEDLEDEIADLRIDNEDLHLEIEDLCEGKALTQELIEQAPDAFFAHDLDGRFVFVNEECCRSIGYTREEFLELSVLDVEYGLNPEQIQAYWDEVADGKTVHSEGTMRRKDGSTFPMEIRIGLFEASGNKVIYGIGRDISERKQLEERLRQAHKMEAVGTLAGGVAHDFNNILGIILGCSELAGDPIADEHPSHEYLTEIKLAVSRAKEVIWQLLSFSQKSDQTREPLPIGPLVKESLKLMRATTSANIELKADIADDCFMVMANASMIHQVIINLCANAAYATRDGGIIEVCLKNMIFKDSKPGSDGVKLNGDFLQLTVSDTGCGMSPELMERIFDPYFTTKDVGKGTGMGLAVVHGIVQSLGGVVTVESELGQGATFDIFLPALAKTDRATASADIYPSSPPTGHERIMVVDDEVLIVKGLKKRLEALGYSVDGFAAPLTALDVYSQQPHRYDLLITDMAMPKMTGEILISKIKEVRADTPVILCTGFSERIDCSAPEKIGAAKILLKPIDRDELASSVRQVLDVRGEDGG